jgi:hypothetical protein
MHARFFQIVENENELWEKNMGASEYVEPHGQSAFAGFLELIQSGT